MTSHQVGMENSADETMEMDSLPIALEESDDKTFQWTAATLCLSLALFLLAGLAEIGGGWLCWQAVREGRPWWWGFAGACILVCYGFLPTLQPMSDFGRIYAVYGGFFILLCYLWGWLLDGFKPDMGDWIGSAVAIVGVSIAWFWPR